MSHHKEHSFDAYCKTILRRTAANAHKQRKRLARPGDPVFRPL